MNLEFQNAKDAKQVENVENRNGFSKADFGKLVDLKDYRAENSDLNLKTNGKIFLKNILGLTGSEISLNYIPANTKSPFLHTHKENEEVYIVLKGNGEFTVNENTFLIKEGSIIRVATKAKRGISSGSEDLVVIAIQTKENSLTKYTLTDAEIIQ